MSEELSPAAQRAAARRAKLLAKGNERLEKLTGAAKSEGRFVNESAGIPPRPNPPPPTSLADVNTDDDPAEIDLATQNALSSFLGGGDGPGAGGANPFAGFPGLGGEGGAAGGQDMFAQMMAQMAQASGGDGAGAPGGGGPGGLGAQGNPFMQPPVSPFPAQPKTLLDRVFPLVHLLAMVGLAVYAIVFLEPAKRVSAYGWTGTEHGIDWSAWGALLSQKPSEYGVASQVVGFHQLAEVPLLWMFVSVELVLQTTRLFLVRNRPAPPGLLNSILPLLSQFSPQLGLAIQTGVRYLDLFSTCLNDLAVLVFCIGVAILVGRWKAGDPGLIQTYAGKTNEMLQRAAGDL
ncbi:hypothetical protein JCM10207_006437 [Rhodosporidiobolus poonsookiae]